MDFHTFITQQAHYSQSYWDMEYLIRAWLIEESQQRQVPFLRFAREHYGDVGALYQWMTAMHGTLLCREDDADPWEHDEHNISIYQLSPLMYGMIRPRDMRTQGAGIELLGVCMPEEMAAWEARLAQVLVTEKPIDPHKVGMLCAGSSGVYIEFVRLADCVFEAGNYTADQRQAFTLAQQNIVSPSPQGRLYILTGIPGSGKSYWIRSLLHTVSAIFVYVPQGMMSEMTSPHILRLLLKQKKGEQDYSVPMHQRLADDRPIVFILEDADSSLMTRMADNNSVVADMLNLTDGLLGDILNVHIIATVNAQKPDIDPALLRPGRLAAHVHFDTLEYAHAHEVFCRLTGCTPSELASHDVVGRTLAEIYTAAAAFCSPHSGEK